MSTAFILIVIVGVAFLSVMLVVLSLSRKTHIETQLANDNKSIQSTKQNINWLLLLISLLLGPAIVIEAGLPNMIIALGVIGGAIGGVAAGILQVFRLRVSRIIKIILYIFLIALIISISISLLEDSGSFLVLLFMMIPGVVSYIVVYFVTKMISTWQTKSLINWWLFGFLLVVGVIISIVAMVIVIGFLALILTFFVLSFAK